MRLFVIILLNILLIFGFPLEDENLCKRKPYLIFCQEQNAEFFESRQQAPEAVDPRPSQKAGEKLHRIQPSPKRTLLPIKESDDSGVEESEASVEESGKKQKPIDLSRPNAEDVAREMGELQKDDTLSSTTTESNEIFDGSTSTTTTTKIHPSLFRTFFRFKRSSLPQPLASVTTTNNKNTTLNKRQHDWVYLDDTDDLDYIAYRKRRARLLRKLNDLDSDHRHYHRSSYRTRSSYQPDLYSDSYSSYGYPSSSYYPSNYYPAYSSSYGYPSSGYYSNPGYLGGYGYRQPFNFGIGSGLNIGWPYGGVGIGSGLGITVG